jgi:hypothetical protein
MITFRKEQMIQILLLKMHSCTVVRACRYSAEITYVNHEY